MDTATRRTLDKNESHLLASFPGNTPVILDLEGIRAVEGLLISPRIKRS